MFTLTQARARFEARFPELQSKARAYFADCKPEAKDESVANSLFLTWHHFTALIKMTCPLQTSPAAMRPLRRISSKGTHHGKEAAAHARASDLQAPRGRGQAGQGGCDRPGLQG